jgi:hypothetical protein
VEGPEDTLKNLISGMPDAERIPCPSLGDIDNWPMLDASAAGNSFCYDPGKYMIHCEDNFALNQALPQLSAGCDHVKRSTPNEGDAIALVLGGSIVVGAAYGIYKKLHNCYGNIKGYLSHDTNEEGPALEEEHPSQTSFKPKQQ